MQKHMETTGPEGHSAVGLKEHCLRIRHLVSGWACPLTLCLCGHPGPKGLASAEHTSLHSLHSRWMPPYLLFLDSSKAPCSFEPFTSHLWPLSLEGSPYSTSVNLFSLANSYQEADSGPGE